MRRKLGDIHGIHGLKRIFKDVKKAARKHDQDDFLGNVIIKLQDLPYTPADEWYPLEPRTETYPDRGQCHLQLKIIHQQRDTTLSKEQAVFSIYRRLLQQFIQFDGTQKQTTYRLGETELSTLATTILSLHATQNDISQFHQDLAQWLVYSKLYQHVQVNFLSLLQHLASIQYQWPQVTLQPWEKQELAESFRSFLDYGILLVQNYRNVFPLTDPKATDRLQSLLRVLVQIWKMTAFHELCSPVSDLQTRLDDAIKSGTIDSYRLQKQELQSSVKSEEEAVKSLVLLVEQLNLDLENNRKIWHKSFMWTAKINLFDITYLKLQELIFEDIREQVVSIGGGKSEGTVEGLFHLYLQLKHLKHQHIYFSKSDSTLPLDAFHTWFSEPLPKWLQAVYNATVQMVHRAVQKDQLEAIGERTKHSTSAVDIATCFSKIQTTWVQLNWPDPEESFVVMVKLTEDMCNIALMYCRLLKARAEDLSVKGCRATSSENSKINSVISLRLCVVLNNMEQLRVIISHLPAQLDWEGLKEDMTDRIEVEQIQNTLHTQLQTTKSSVNKEIKSVLQTLAQKLHMDIKIHIQHLAASSHSVPLSDMINPLMNFLVTEFAYMDTNLVQENFQSLLGFLWMHIIDILSTTSSHSDVSQDVYARLQYALRHLVQCFHAEGNGLPLDQLQNASFKALETKLKLNAASTQELIQKFFVKKAEQQAFDECSKYGAVTIKVFYNNQGQKLHVEILNAVNLIPLDSNGTSDPFVQLTLEPKHIFPAMESKTTQRKKNELNPLFDEIFEFSNVTPEQCGAEGACLLLTVFDYDTLVTDDLEGEAFFPLHNVPGRDSSEGTLNSTNVLQSRLSLSHPKPNEDTILKLLELRKRDKDAQALVKIRRQREKKSMERH
uniref:Unc-13 homolog D n=2 Tax=Callorhinchus milii TaxID=7868 RepID=A0A4W3KB43_CALMI